MSSTMKIVLVAATLVGGLFALDAHAREGEGVDGSHGGFAVQSGGSGGARSGGFAGVNAGGRSGHPAGGFDRGPSYGGYRPTHVYGFNGFHDNGYSCPQLVRVPTSRGWRWHRVEVCR